MQLIKYDPFRELRKIERDLDNIWGHGRGLLSSAGGDISAMDLYEEDNKLIAEVHLPNFKKEEIKVTADRGILEVSAEHKEEAEEGKKDSRRYYFRESTNQYYRRVTLPEGVKADKVEASFNDGILKVAMPIEPPVEAKSVVIT